MPPFLPNLSQKTDLPLRQRSLGAFGWGMDAQS